MNPGTPGARRLGMRRARVTVGDRFMNLSADGGGHGNPRDRDLQRVAEDVLDGYVSTEAARSVRGDRAG